MSSLNQNFQNQIEKALNIKLKKCQPITTGMNNQLFKLTDTKSKTYLLKQYVQDDRNRLWREFNAIKFFKKHKFKNVPRAIWQNPKNHAAIYSFEPGSTKKVKELNSADMIKMANFLVRLHAISLKFVKIEFPPAVMACFSIEDYIKNIDFRLTKFLEHMSNPHPLIGKKIDKFKLSTLFEKLKNQTLADLNEKEIKNKLPKSNQRLCPADFGPHNMLVDNFGNECFIDFEYFGMDDPARVLANFQVHDRSFSIDNKLKQLFRNHYLESIKASSEFKKHLSLIEAIISIEWLSIYLWSITPEKIAHRKFSNKNFNEKLYIKQQLNKFEKRLSALKYK